MQHKLKNCLVLREQYLLDHLIGVSCHLRQSFQVDGRTVAVDLFEVNRSARLFSFEVSPEANRNLFADFASLE